MKRILLQLDTDALPSSFDRIVAVDAGVDQVFSYGGVTPDNVEPLVHGAVFTRGAADLKNTAIFIGGSNVQSAEKVLARVQQVFFGPMHVSVLLDANGSSTTAAATVKCAAKHMPLKGAEALVLGGTGPVGQRTAHLLALQGACVRIASREPQKAEAVASTIRTAVKGSKVTPADTSDHGLAAAVDGVQLIIGAGPAGVQFLTTDEWQSIDTLKVAIDLNAVPPLGLEGIDVNDEGTDREGKICYGAIGIGGLKMKIHKAAVERLFAANDHVLDIATIYSLAESLNA